MRYLLDTHALIWALDAPERLPIEVRELLLDRANLPVGVAAITPWEIAMLATRGRLQLGRAVGDWLAAALRPEFVVLLPLIPPIAVDSCTLPGEFHADPADRLIVATARHHGLTLITADEAIRAYPHLRTVWD
jgi:PIN domain nuclease of toxin-antitoxin system